jgi:hypothetical protein
MGGLREGRGNEFVEGGTLKLNNNNKNIDKLTKSEILVR